MSPKVLITGVTGYIGGSILTILLNSAKTSSSTISISVLFRGEEKAKIYENLGVQTFLFSNLDETELLRQVAGQHDVVIHTASGFHTSSAIALIQGLADRAKSTGNPVHYIHTSGTSNLADQPITRAYKEPEARVFSDKENIYAYEKSREVLQVYAQRTTDLAIVESGLALGVKTTIIMSPTIYGVGTGLGNTLSIQVPTIMRASLKSGQVGVVGDGKGEWDYVHIADLASLYEIVLSRVIKGEDIPSGENGILFSGTGRYTWIELSRGIAGALFKLGAIKTDEVKSTSIEEAADRWSGGLLLRAELGFASNSRTTPEVSRGLGWEPQKTEEDFQNHFLEEARLVVATEAKA
ncbi:NAD(P)-binding protein [Stipitochalara longipes BDJ]|nr:NAD(P)-binding protein [Stipitochalara longipes BDJ]